jgi:hypothetical protein
LYRHFAFAVAVLAVAFLCPFVPLRQGIYMEFEVSMAEKKVALLGKESILAVQDVASEIVEVPEWGGSVRVRGLTGAERDAFEGEVIQRNGRDVTTNTRNMRARLVVMSVIDEEGKRLFGFPDIEALGAKSARALDRIFGVAMRLSGLRDEDVEELTERFAETPSGG